MNLLLQDSLSRDKYPISGANIQQLGKSESENNSVGRNSRYKIRIGIENWI